MSSNRSTPRDQRREFDREESMRAALSHIRLGPVLGTGSYSIVFEAHEAPSAARSCALKVIDNIVNDSEDARRLLREMRIVSQLQHPHIVRFLGAAPPQNPVAYRQYAILFERYDATLGTVLNGSQRLSAEHVQFFMFQLLQALAFIHESGVIHADIKPANLLVNANCRLALCDFNLARSVRMWELELIQTSWYRAPEVIIGEVLPGTAIDIWSAGCIFAELLRSTECKSAGALFPIVDKPQKQLRAIVALVHDPPKSADGIASRPMREYLQSAIATRASRQQCIHDEFEKFGPACGLLSRMLSFSAESRPSARVALADSYFDDMSADYTRGIKYPEAGRLIDMTDIDHVAIMSEPSIRAGLNTYLVTHPAPALQSPAVRAPAETAAGADYKKRPSSAVVGAATSAQTP